MFNRLCTQNHLLPLVVSNSNKLRVELRLNGLTIVWMLERRCFPLNRTPLQHNPRGRDVWISHAVAQTDTNNQRSTNPGDSGGLINHMQSEEDDIMRNIRHWSLMGRRRTRDNEGFVSSRPP